jgi:hypothetical protein
VESKKKRTIGLPPWISESGALFAFHQYKQGASKQIMCQNTNSAAGGPRTPEGKAVSSRNAVTHGLTARSPILPWEDPAEFEAYRDSYFEMWKPETPHFRKLVAQYADISWRLDRSGSQEAQFIRNEVKQIQISVKDSDRLNQLVKAIGKDDPLALEALAMSRLFQGRTLINLHRHEDRLQRRLNKVRAEIDELSSIAEKARALESLQIYREETAARATELSRRQNELLGGAPEYSAMATQPQQLPAFTNLPQLT